MAQGIHPALEILQMFRQQQLTAKAGKRKQYALETVNVLEVSKLSMVTIRVSKSFPQSFILQSCVHFLCLEGVLRKVVSFTCRSQQG